VEAKITEEEEDDFLEEEDDESTDDSTEELFLDVADDDDDLSNNPALRLKRVNARRALEDYFEEKLLREEDFDDFSISSDSE